MEWGLLLLQIILFVVPVAAGTCGIAYGQVKKAIDHSENWFTLDEALEIIDQRIEEEFLEEEE